jgi:hypothetical protein
MDKNSWTDRVRNGVLRRINEETNVLHTMKRSKGHWAGHILRRNSLLKYIEVRLTQE